MLKNTLILPEGDGPVAAKLLRDAIADLDVILMLILGREDPILQIVTWADQLCNKTRVSETINARRVVWICLPEVQEVRQVLDQILGQGPRTVVAVLNFHDAVADRIDDATCIDPIRLEKAFLKGHKI